MAAYTGTAKIGETCSPKVLRLTCVISELIKTLFCMRINKVISEALLDACMLSECTRCRAAHIFRSATWRKIASEYEYL